MELSALAGNLSLKRQLSAQDAGRGLSHAYLISGPAGSGKETLARLMAAAMVCTGGGERPCGTCPACKKARANIHPDITLAAPLEGKREILVDQIRQIRADAYIRPNEAERKVYIIKDAQTMNPSAQNSILKLLEEGPVYAAFLLLCDNPGALLPTIRSRCEGLALSPVSEEEAEEWLRRRYPNRPVEEIRRAAQSCAGLLGQAVSALEGAQDGEVRAAARQLLGHLCQGDELALLQWCVALEKWDRDALGDLLEEGVALLRDALAVQAGGQSLSGPEEAPVVSEAAALPRRKLLGAVACLKELQRGIPFYVGTGHLCGALCAGLSRLQ